MKIDGLAYVGFGQTLDDTVPCPNCKEPHTVPTTALRVFYKVDDDWQGAAFKKRTSRA